MTHVRGLNLFCGPPICSLIDSKTLIAKRANYWVLNVSCVPGAILGPLHMWADQTSQQYCKIGIVDPALTDEEAENGEIKLKESKFTWLSVQQNCSVCPGPPECKARKAFPGGITARGSTHGSLSPNGSVGIVEQLVCSTAHNSVRQIRRRAVASLCNKHYLPDIRCRQLVFYLWLIYSILPWENKTRVLSSK